MVRLSRLFGNAGSQRSKQHPAEKRDGSRKEETPDFYKKDSGKNENGKYRERKGEEMKRRGISDYRRMQTEQDTASKCRGDRYGRQPHGTLRNLASVSM
jgi:hypothetical protein